MKTERITILASPDFKVFLAKEAKAAGISVSELVRQRCAPQPSADEQLLLDLSRQLREATKSANRALDSGLNAVAASLAAIRKLRQEQEETA